MKKHIIIIFIAILCVSCEDFFISTVDMDIPKHNSKIVPVAFLGTPTLLNKGKSIQIARSLASMDNNIETSDLFYIGGAKVSITSENQTIQYQEDPTNYGAYITTDTLNFIPGAVYKLTIEKQGYPTVTATQTYPKTVPIISAQIEGNVLKFKLKDEPNVENYYVLNLLVKGVADNIGNITFETYENDYIDTYQDLNGIMFTDETFDGKIKEFRGVLNNVNITPNQEVYVLLSHVSKDYYLYLKSLDLNQDIEKDPFAVASFLYSNINEGYGIFSLRNTYQMQIQ